MQTVLACVPAAVALAVEAVTLVKLDRIRRFLDRASAALDGPEAARQAGQGDVPGGR